MSTNPLESKRGLFWDSITGDPAKRTEAAGKLGQRVTGFFSRSRLPEQALPQEEPSQSFLSRLTDSQPRDLQKAEVLPQQGGTQDSPQLERKISEEWLVLDEDPKKEDSENNGRVFETLQSRRLFPEWNGHQQRSFEDEDRTFKGGWAGCDYDSSPESYLAASSSSSSPVTPSSELAPIGKDETKREAALCLGSVDYPHQKDAVLSISKVISSVDLIEQTSLENMENVSLLRVTLDNLETERNVLVEKGGADSEIAEISHKIDSIENSISQLLKQINVTSQKRQEEIQNGYVTLLAQFGEMFERDFECAKALILQAHEMEGKNVPEHEVTLEVLRSMEKALTGGDDGADRSIFRQRHIFSTDIWRSAVVIDEHLVSNLESDGFHRIVDPIGQEYSFDEGYGYIEALIHAKQSDENFQDPKIDKNDSRGKGEWMGNQVDRYLDQQGIGLVERHRIYSQAHQRAIIEFLTINERSQEHLERAKNLDLPVEERFTEYCRASFKVGRMAVESPDPKTWDAAFVAYFDTRLNDAALEGKLSSKVHIIDLQSKCVHAHYLMSYPDPVEKQRRVYHYHMRYDYVGDEKIVTVTPGIEGFPHPQTLDEMPRFSIGASKAQKDEKADRA